MLEEISVVEWAHRSACAQAQAYCPCEPETKHDVDYCLPSLEALGLSPDSLPRRNGDLSHSIHLKDSCPHFFAMLD